MSTADGYRLVVQGELDLATAPTRADQLTEAERGRPGVLTLDLSELRFISAAGMRVVLDAARRAKPERRAYLRSFAGLAEEIVAAAC